MSIDARAESGKPRPPDPQRTPPQVALPKGGGAIHGIGEKFAANPVTGTGALTVPIAVSPGRSGFGPQLSLSYDSGAGNGPFGFGWSLSLPSITRKTDRGLPEYRDADESDVYILSGAEDLVPVLRPDGSRFRDDATAPGFVIHRYRPRVEGLFSRIERWTEAATGEIHWRSISRDNVTTLYGTRDDARIRDPDPVPGRPARVFSWLIAESRDDRGNAIRYRYAAENGAGVELAQANERNRVRTANRYIKHIQYGNRKPLPAQPDPEAAEWLFEVVFDYGEGHYRPLAPDGALPAERQHTCVRASLSAGGAWPVRPDPFSVHRAGWEVRTYRRCRRVLMFHRFAELGPEPCLVRCTEFDYADLDYSGPVAVEAELEHQGSTRFGSFIRAVTQSGYVRDATRPVVPDGGARYVTYLRKSLPPLELQYSKAAIQDRVREVDAGSVENLPAGLDGAAYQWVDLDGESVSGILTEQAGAWFYKRNLGGGRFGPARAVDPRPSLSALGAGGQRLLDLAGDGQLDLVALDGPTPGFYERTAEGGWEPFRPFRQLPDLAWNDPNLRFVDLDGDGHADVLVTEQDAVTWYPSLAEAGFGPARRVRQAVDEERGPRLVLADGTQSIYLADMCGDGLADLVRVRNGEVCYWPSLGRGRFGPRVTLDNAPRLDHPDHFDQRRVHLADIDGSGTTDLIYLGRDGARLYFNQAGNRLSGPRLLAGFPPLDSVASVTTADLLGNGTACLVWSSPLPADARRPLRYIDLTGGVKPHLLVRCANNLGAETEVEYAPSTRFYLADRQAGRPWVTRLPFPVHVVERVVTRDRVSRGRFVTRYAYHHGYFDGVEREFRGFGMVEQWDTGEVGAPADGPPAANEDAASQVPPVHTRSWFHTGVYLGRGHVSDFFAGVGRRTPGEYWREPGLTEAGARALLLDDTVLPAGLTVEEEREACRALKGSLLRQEVFADDGPGRRDRPYLVTEQNFTLRPLQRRGPNRHGVWLAHPRESVACHYERSLVPVLRGAIVDEATARADPDVRWLPDPRVSHTLTLEVDDFGNVVRSAAVGYGRRYPDLRLPEDADRRRQTAVLATCVENRFTRSHDTGAEAIDTARDYRTPLPAEARTCELTGLVLPAGRVRFTFAEVLDAAAAAAPLDYEREPTAGRLEKRLIEHVRTVYRRDDLAGPLPPGALQPRALPYEAYRLAFTPGLVARAYGGRATPAMLEDDARYVHGEGDVGWWIPSGQVFYSPDPTATAAEELAFAREHFFLPHRYRDPFHTPARPTESFAAFDRYTLLVQETTDALGNRVTVGERDRDPTRPPVRLGNDYRVLQPALVMDPNRNRTEAAFDALGLVAGTAVMGKPEDSPVPGDRLTPAFRADLTRAEIDAFVADPRGAPAAALLAQATTRVVYDLDAWMREPDPARRAPAVAATLARETHASEPAPAGGVRIQVSLGYSDGFGREIQKKAQAEPGPVPVRGADGRVVPGADGRPVLTAADAAPRWVGSGWTVFNNKGKPVRQYEPFFTDTHRFEPDARIGVSPVLFYDPLERVVATLHPDHSWEKVVFDPWRQETWDGSDTAALADPAADPDVGGHFARLPPAEYLPTWQALRTDPAHAARAAARWPDPELRLAERRAAEKAAVHARTPTAAHADALGRAFLTVVHNRWTYGDAPPAVPPAEEFHHTRVLLDVEGNQREVTDAAGRVVMRYDHDMLGTRVRQSSMEAGERWTLHDAAGKPLYAWDSRGHRFFTAYDRLRRPTEQRLLAGAGPEVVIGRTVYGESRPTPEAANLRGRVVELRDQAGIVTSDAYDFKGNLLSTGRRLARAYDATLDWSGAVALEGETFTGHTAHDALNRPTQMVAPHGDAPGTAVNVVRPVYNEAGLLEQVHAWLGLAAEPAALLDPATAGLHAVTNIDYDAKGQRTRTEHGLRGGGAVTTRYDYDPFTFRLARLLTGRPAAAYAADCPATPDPAWPGCHVQDLRYSYDPVGNVTAIRDDAQQAVYFRNRRVDPSADYTYDAAYRLIEATGREQLGLAGEPVPHSYNDVPRTAVPHRGDGAALGRYLERYVYDLVGNLTSMQHRVGGSPPAGWVRAYTYAEPSLLEPARAGNRLTGTTVGGRTETYSTAGDGYDAHGNLLRMPHLREMRWDFADRLRMTRRQAVDASDADGVLHHGERTWYVYDAAGQRVRKVTVSESGAVQSERIYLGGFEVYRRHGAAPLARETLHVMDGDRRVALVETRTAGTEAGVPRQLVRYQLGNHLGSAALELDDDAQVVTYEEYTPFGSTSYQGVRSAVPPRRYRYTGKERDEESGLYYHGARYYAPWLGRWTSADPSGIEDGPNPYAYVQNRPIIANDPNGRWANIVIGALIGAAVGAAVEFGRQVYRGEEISGGRIAAAAGGGLVAGGIAGATMGLGLLVEGAGVVGGSVVGGTVTREINREPTTLEAVGTDALVAVATFGVMRGGGAAWSRLRGPAGRGAAAGEGAASGSAGSRSAGSPGRSAPARAPASEPAAPPGPAARPASPPPAAQPSPGPPPRVGAVRPVPGWEGRMNEFGRAIRWGTRLSPESAREAAANVTDETLRNLGVTREVAEQLLQDYRQVAANEFASRNPTIAGRIAFMEEIVRRLGGRPGPAAPTPPAAPAAVAPSTAPAAGAAPQAPAAPQGGLGPRVQSVAPLAVPAAVGSQSDRRAPNPQQQGIILFQW